MDIYTVAAGTPFLNSLGNDDGNDSLLTDDNASGSITDNDIVFYIDMSAENLRNIDSDDDFYFDSASW